MGDIPSVNLAEKLPSILGRMNPIIDNLRQSQSNVQALEEQIESFELEATVDFTLLFNNVLV